MLNSLIKKEKEYVGLILQPLKKLMVEVIVTSAGTYFEEIAFLVLSLHYSYVNISIGNYDRQTHNISMHTALLLFK